MGGYQLSHGGYHIVVITWPVITRSSHGITWSISVSLLKEICPPDQDYEPPDQGLCARANWVTHSHQPTNVQHTALRSSKTTFHPKSKKLFFNSGVSLRRMQVLRRGQAFIFYFISSICSHILSQIYLTESIQCFCMDRDF